MRQSHVDQQSTVNGTVSLNGTGKAISYESHGLPKNLPVRRPQEALKLPSGYKALIGRRECT